MSHPKVQTDTLLSVDIIGDIISDNEKAVKKKLKEAGEWKEELVNRKDKSGRSAAFYAVYKKSKMI